MVDEIGTNYSAKYEERQEQIECPFCKKGKIEIIYIPAWYEWRTSHISAGSKRTKFYHDSMFKVQDKCPDCNASKEQIKNYLEKGKKPITHEERIEMFKKRGLPLVLNSKK